MAVGVPGATRDGHRDGVPVRVPGLQALDTFQGRIRDPHPVIDYRAFFGEHWALARDRTPIIPENVKKTITPAVVADPGGEPHRG